MKGKTTNQDTMEWMLTHLFTLNAHLKSRVYSTPFNTFFKNHYAAVFSLSSFSKMCDLSFFTHYFKQS